MLAIELDVQRIESMASWANGDPNRISIFRDIARGSVERRLVLRFVELEADVGQIVELGDSGTLYFGLDPTLQDTIEKCVDV
jgi:hypothetical protein